jgi:hypothetical protein
MMKRSSILEDIKTIFWIWCRMIHFKRFKTIKAGFVALFIFFLTCIRGRPEGCSFGY